MTIKVIIFTLGDDKSMTKDDCLQGQMSDTLIGRVHVQDRDDWDVPDKVFYWDTNEHVRFRLNEDSGMITMRKGTPDGRYLLRFKVYDRRHTRTEVCWLDFVRVV